MKHLLQKLSLAVILLTLSVGLKAQVTTSSLRGTITDEITKETLFGATVRVKHLPTGTLYGAVTNEKGNYLLDGLKPGGPYVIEFEYMGYSKKVFKDMSLPLGEVKTLNVWLKEDSQMLTEVFVVGDKNEAFNSRRTGAASNFGRKAIENAPSVSRSLFDIAKLTPQANITSSGISFSGSNNRYNSFQIDGTVSNDVFGLSSSGTNGGKTGANPISLEAIDAIQVVIAPFDVRQSGFTGGGINAITKSGTNTFKGSAYNFYKNQYLYGTTPGKDVEKRKYLANQYENTVGFTLGGPIIKNKLFFFANAEYTKELFPASYGINNGSKVTEADVQAVQKRVRELTNGAYDGGSYGNLDVPAHSARALLRLDWNINQDHKFSLRYSYLNAARTNYGNSPRDFKFLDSRSVTNNNTHSLVAELNSRFGNNFSNELRIGYNRVRDWKDVPNTSFPSVKIGYGEHPKITLGIDPFSYPNQLDQDILTVTNNLTWNKGDHSIVFGTHNEFFDMYNLFIDKYSGSYEYSNLEDFLDDNTPYKYEYKKVNTANTNGEEMWGPRIKAAQLGFYVQDKWKVNDRLRLTYGLRLDMPLFFGKPTANQKFNDSEFAKEHDYVNNRMPMPLPLVSPRIGFRYNIDKKGDYVLRGGAGIFTGRIPFVWIANVFKDTGVQFETTSLYRDNKTKKFNSVPNFKFNPDPKQQFSKAGSSEVDFIARKFMFPQVARFNLAVDANLPFGIKGSIEAMFTKNINNILYRNLNIEQNDKPNPKYVAPFIGERKQYKPVSRNYTSLMMLDNTNKGYTYNITATLSKDFACGLSTSVAYTYGKSMAVMAGSHIAYSSWQYQPVINSTNDEELSYSNFDLRHRVVANISYKIAYAKHYATTIGLYYNGQSGQRFSMTYASDINGDKAKNDLFYMPTDEEIEQYKFAEPYKGKGLTSQEHRANFKEFIANNPQLKAYQGQIIPRNGLEMPFIHQLDLHFAQDFYLNYGGRKHTFQLNADIQNLGNMLNRGWGLRYRVSHNNLSPMKYEYGAYKFSKISKMWDISDMGSRWRAQIGLKYIF